MADTMMKVSEPSIRKQIRISKQNYAWFVKANLEKYAGHWIAIAQKKVIAEDENLRRVEEKIENVLQKEKITETPIITKIPIKAQILIL